MMVDNVKVLEKSIVILNTLGESTGRDFSLAEISRLTEMPKTTTRRILNTLVNYNYLEYDENSQKYRLGLQVLKLGVSMLNDFRLKDYIQEYSVMLRDLTNCTVFVGILNGFEVIYVEKVPASITMTADIGYRVPAHCTAMGQVLLSQLDEATLDRLLSENTLVKKTDFTLTDVGMFKDRVRRVREQGYAIDEREHRNEIRCIAAPIKDHTGKAVAAISISNVVTLFDEKRKDQYIEQVIAIAKSISERLGCLDYSV
jgi:DNA-binding IclR family transcriptional regulator